MSLERFFNMTRPARFRGPDPNWIAQEQAIGADAIQPYGFIADGVVAFPNFASTIIPPRVVTSLPSLPSATWPQGSIVFLTTDQKLYRNTDGSTWQRRIDGGLDIVADTVVAGSIAAGAIGADEIAANAIQVGHMMGNPNNECPNPGYEFLGSTTVLDTDGGIGNLPGWTVGANGAKQQIPSSATVHGGRYCWLATQPNPIGDTNIETANIPVMIPRRYRLSAFFRGLSGNSAAAKGSLYVRYRNAAGASQGFITLDGGGTLKTLTVGTSTVWTQVADYFLIPAGAAFINIGIQNTASGSAVGDVVMADDIELYPADYDLKHTAGNVIIDSTGIAVTNGKITVTNAGSTVVIDGTSNMFKILATGTLSRAWPGGSASASTTATISGSGASILALLWSMTPTSTAGDFRISMSYIGTNTSGNVIAQMHGTSDISAGDNIVSLDVNHPTASAPFSGATALGRYYLLKEAGI